MPLKTLKKKWKKLRRRLARKQKYGIIIKKDGLYDYWYFWLAPDDKEILSNLLVKNKKVQIIEIRKIPQDFTEKQIKHRVEILNHREMRDQNKRDNRTIS